MLYYSQLDGLWGDPTGAVIKLSAPCISGNNIYGQDANQPSSQYLHNRGPLPQGLYTIGVLKQQNAVHSQGCTLTPDPGNFMGNPPRSDFYLHLRRAMPEPNNPGSSDGCPTFKSYADLFLLWSVWVHKQGQSQVKVVATVANFPNTPLVTEVVEEAPDAAPDAATTPTPDQPLPPSADAA